MTSKIDIGRGNCASTKPGLTWNRASSLAGRKTDCGTDESFQRFVDIAPECIIISQDDRIIYVNQVAVDQLAVGGPDDLIGRNELDFVMPADRQRVKALARQLDQEGAHSELTRFQRVGFDGNVLDLEAVAVRILWGGRPAIITMSRDVTARLHAEARLQGFLATATDLLWETNEEHRYSYISYTNQDDPTVAALYGMTRWEVAGVASDDDERWRDHVADLEARRPFSNFEFQIATGRWHGQYRSTSGIPIFDTHGVFKGYRGTSRNITDSKTAEQTIERMARHDSLTGLPNRAYFESELRRICSAVRHCGARVTVMFLDLDHFKDVNDTLGHSVGDRLLIEVARRLKLCVRESDLVARLGGDEFVIVLGEPCESASISDLADRLLMAIDEPFQLDGHLVHSSTSIGVAVFPDDGGDAEQILARADLALYAAKEAGRHTWRIFDHQLHERLQAQFSLHQDLRRALDQKQFELHYQPIVDMASNRVSCFEALIRWNHPTGEQLSPDAFIPNIERSNLAIPLTDWVFAEVALQLKRWASTELADFKIAINVPPILLKHQSFIELVDSCITKNGCDPRRLVIEITEGTLIEEAKAIPVLTALQQRGVTIAVDDFGTGYSSMVRLKSLPVDVLKIDRSFLCDAMLGSNGASIVEALVRVGRSLGKRVVAEGVESREQFSFLKRIECDMAQGFVISHPMTAADIPVWFDDWQS